MYISGVRARAGARPKVVLGAGIAIRDGSFVCAGSGWDVALLGFPLFPIPTTSAFQPATASTAGYQVHSMFRI